MENKKYEYKVIEITKLEGLENMLNMYGSDGWELVGFSSNAVHVMSVIRTYGVILKREITK